MIQMVQTELQANRPSQDDAFARRVQFFTATLAGNLGQMQQLIRQDHTLLTTVVEWKMALKKWLLAAGFHRLASCRGER